MSKLFKWYLKNWKNLLRYVKNAKFDYIAFKMYQKA